MEEVRVINKYAVQSRSHVWTRNSPYLINYLHLSPPTSHMAYTYWHYSYSCSFHLNHLPNFQTFDPLLVLFSFNFNIPLFSLFISSRFLQESKITFGHYVIHTLYTDILFQRKNQTKSQIFFFVWAYKLILTLFSYVLKYIYLITRWSIFFF